MQKIKDENKKIFTERELEVLEFLVQGKTNDEIAELLIVSKSTIKAHIRSLYRKPDTKNRVETVVKALKLEFIEI